MHGIISYYERIGVKFVRKIYRMDNINAMTFQDKVRYFKEKNRKKFHVNGTIHFRHTGKTMPVE